MLHAACRGEHQDYPQPLLSGPPAVHHRDMTKYLISFPSEAMVLNEDELPAVSADSHAVIREVKAAGIYVFGRGIEEEVDPVLVAADGSVSTGIYPGSEFKSGFTCWSCRRARTRSGGPGRLRWPAGARRSSVSSCTTRRAGCAGFRAEPWRSVIVRGCSTLGNGPTGPATRYALSDSPHQPRREERPHAPQSCYRRNVRISLRRRYPFGRGPHYRRWEHCRGRVASHNDCRSEFATIPQQDACG